jgi:hypothetical protein
VSVSEALGASTPRFRAPAAFEEQTKESSGRTAKRSESTRRLGAGAQCSMWRARVASHNCSMWRARVASHLDEGATWEGAREHQRLRLDVPIVDERHLKRQRRAARHHDGLRKTKE